MWSLIWCGLARVRSPSVDELHLVDHLIAVYPTWWGGLPATLLDWVQRTLCPVD